MATVLRCESLVRRLGDRDVVRGASLDLDEAASVALVGPSGCGKTTLLQMIGLLFERIHAGYLDEIGVLVQNASPRFRIGRGVKRLDQFFFSHYPAQGR